MRALCAFTKKEWMEQVRSGRLLILVFLFVLLGIMNPAIAKLTPWLFDIMSEAMTESGMTVTVISVDAVTSWVQFFKNAPMGLIAFILLESSLFTKEYQSGTLILALTKGLNRATVVISKAGILAVLWSACYWLCFAITYAYNDFFWDNSIAQNLIFSVTCWWLLGIWAVALTVQYSTMAASNTSVLAGTAATFFGAYLIGLIPKAAKYSPSMLMDSSPLIYGTETIEAYGSAVIITVALSVLCFAISIPCLNKKQF